MDSELLGLLATVEDAFGFAIPEEDVQRLHTVGDLNDCIAARRFGNPREGCLNAIVFHKLQRALMWVLKISREDVRASTEVSAVIPSRRFRTWRALERATGLRLPQLRRPQWVMTVAALTTFGTAVGVPWLLGLGPLNGAVFVGLLTSIAVALCLSWITVPLAVELQPDCTTIGGLTAATTARNYPAIVEEAGRLQGDEAVWHTLRTILAEHWGVDPHSITREMDLHRHLVAA